ncbi:MAG TPA: hypothetical protein VK960_01630 [Acidimicrobiia bacterium]|nr:hypothetical protein [Acidimicrobiia bacterium]
MNAGRLFVGSTIAALGVLFLLDSAELIEAGEAIAAWWPAAIVALGVFHAASGRGPTGGSFTLVGIGLGLLGVTTGLFGDDAWAYVWPAALVLVGIWLIFGWGRRLGSRPADDDEIDGIAVLGSALHTTTSKGFRRASLTAVLGGVTLDLEDALPIAGGASVSVTLVMGSVVILVPRGWVVEIRGLPLMGGWDDTTDRTAIVPGAPRLEVQALCVLGGLEVKHASRWS